MSTVVGARLLVITEQAVVAFSVADGEIAWVRLDAEDTDEPASVTPIYLHQPGVPHP